MSMVNAMYFSRSGSLSDLKVFFKLFGGKIFFLSRSIIPKNTYRKNKHRDIPR